MSTQNHENPASGMARFKRFWALVDVRNKEFLRDHAALAWNFLFPFLIVGGFGFAFSGNSQDFFKVAVHGSATQTGAAEFFETKYIQFIPDNDLGPMLEKLKRHQIDMVVSSGKYWINSTSPKGYLLERLLIGAQKPTAGTTSSVPNSYEKQTVEGREIRYVDWLIAGIIGMNMMFSALFGVGYVIVRYRKNGVLKRLKATPLAAFDFLAAQIVSRVFLIVGVSAIVYGGSHAVLHFQMLGSYWDLSVILLLGSLCLISLGLLVAAMVSSEEFAGGLLNMVSWPMMFLSGVWFSLEGMNPWIKKAANIFPLTHVIEASRKIMTEGATLGSLGFQIWILAILTVVFLTIGSLTFKWE
ncbi:MAG: ABC transporter permease [Bdellovibrionales bacterium]|nr:ABC transporter permease [Bdellovibrionales bacterium]